MSARNSLQRAMQIIKAEDDAARKDEERAGIAQAEAAVLAHRISEEVQFLDGGGANPFIPEASSEPPSVAAIAELVRPAVDDAARKDAERAAAAFAVVQGEKARYGLDLVHARATDAQAADIIRAVLSVVSSGVEIDPAKGAEVRTLINSLSTAV